MHQHVVEHAAERVVGRRVLRRDLDRLADGDAERSGRVRVLSEDGAPGRGGLAVLVDPGRTGAREAEELARRAEAEGAGLILLGNSFGDAPCAETARALRRGSRARRRCRSRRCSASR